MCKRKIHYRKKPDITRVMSSLRWCLGERSLNPWHATSEISSFNEQSSSSWLILSFEVRNSCPEQAFLFFLNQYPSLPIIWNSSIEEYLENQKQRNETVARLSCCCSYKYAVQRKINRKGWEDVIFICRVQQWVMWTNENTPESSPLLLV